MKLEVLLQAVLLFSGAYFNAVGTFVGMNIGTDVSISNLPPAADIVAFLKAQKINHVRLFNADAHLLNALANTGIEVMVSVTNEEVLGIANSASNAAAWIKKNVYSYVPSTNITAIAVGSEVLTSIPHIAHHLFKAMSNVHLALVDSNLNRIKVSTPHSMDIIISPSFPPSAAVFKPAYNSTIFQILQFLKNTNSFYMLNAYPYYEYVKNGGIFTLDYALSKPQSSGKQIVDPITLLHYHSMFEALVDAAYHSMLDLNFPGIPIVVTETGWPSFGGKDEPAATAANAKIYNNNLVRRVLNDLGPPSRPEISINTYIYELFNEDKRPGPVSERNWGVVFANGSAVYDLSLSSPDSGYCIAKAGVGEDSLQSGLNWACGPGQANCSPIQKGQPCYEPDTLLNHASYAYNDYYQRARNVGGTCDFEGTATYTFVDPSHGSCKFTISSNSTNSTGTISPPPALGPMAPISRSSRNVVLHFGTITVTTITILFLLIANSKNIL